MALEQRRPFGSAWDGPDELIHIIHNGIITIPPLNPGERKTLRFEPNRTGVPRIVQPNHKGLTILDARHNHETGDICLLVSVCRSQNLQVVYVAPGGHYSVKVDSQPRKIVHAVVLESYVQPKGGNPLGPDKGESPDGNVLAFIRVDISGKKNTFVERTIRIAPA
jgi:hypothetical protein